MNTASNSKSKLKIAMIVSMKCGVSQFMYRDIDALVAKGHDVTLFTLRLKPGLYNPRPAWKVVAASLWRAIVANLWFCLRHPARYARLLAEAAGSRSLADLAIAVQFAKPMRDADVIYSYFGDHKLFVGYYCKKLLNKPLLTAIQAYELHHNPNPAMLRRALPKCERILTVSEFNKRQLVERHGGRAERIEVVRQIIDLEELRADPKIKVLIVGFFAEKKGHDILFEALRRLQRHDIELWVVGDNAADRNNMDCRQMVKTLGIERQVAFFGSQGGNALRALYRECDVFCLPSRTDCFGDKEGFPTVIAEAMAMGKPVVSTRHAGIPEVVDALLVDEGNAEQLAEALSAVCDDVALQQRLGRRNRELAEQLFSSANNDRLEEVLWQYSVGKSAGSLAETPKSRALKETPLRINQRVFTEAAQRLHSYLLRTHWNGEAVVGPDPGIRLNARFGRFIKSYLNFLPWKDHIAYIQGQRYWISSNLQMAELGVGDAEECREVSVRCADFLLARQADEGYWPHPNREWKHRIATVEGNYGAIALAETYQQTGDAKYLAGAKSWYEYATRVIGFQRPSGHLAINYFAHRQGEIVPNVSASALRAFAHVAEAAGDERHLEHCAGMVAWLRQVQLATGELPYAVAGPVQPERPDRVHFLCGQYNAFQLIDLAAYFQSTGDDEVLPVIANLGRFVASGITESGALRYDCHHLAPEVPYYTMAAATALSVATQMQLGQYTDLAERAYKRVLSLQKPAGDFAFYSRGNYGILSDRRSYPRYLSMILLHLLMAADAIRGCQQGQALHLEESAV